MYLSVGEYPEITSLVDQVLVDGVDVTHLCTELDTEERYAICYVEGKDGIKLTECRDGEVRLKIRRIEGEITVVFRPGTEDELERLLAHQS